jgi:hypothetical protein
MTKMTTLAALSAACAILAGCGGDGSATPPAPAPAPVAPQQFTYFPLAAGETDVWTRVLTDTAGNSVTMQIRQRIVSVDDAGVRLVTWDDPTGTEVVEDGLEFRVNQETEHVSASGAASDYTLTSSSGAQVSCVYGTASTSSGTGGAEAARATAQGLRHLESLNPGESWASAYTIACGSAAPIAYSVTAAVFPLETVSVTAGTFQAFRETVETTWVFNGFANSSSVTLWRDPARSMFPVKLDEVLVHGDTSKASFAHETRELLSRQ